MKFKKHFDWVLRGKFYLWPRYRALRNRREYFLGAWVWVIYK